MNGKTSVENVQSMCKEREILPKLQEMKQDEVKR